MLEKRVKGISFLKKILFFVCMSLSLCVPVHHMHAEPKEVRKGIRLPGTGMTGVNAGN